MAVALKDHWFKTRQALVTYLINKEAKPIAQDYWKLGEKTVVIMQDKSVRSKGWTFGYL